MTDTPGTTPLSPERGLAWEQLSPEERELFARSWARHGKKCKRETFEEANRCYETALLYVGEVLGALDRARAERGQFADRVDTLTAVAQSNKRNVQHMYAELQEVQRERDALRDRVAELEEGARVTAELDAKLDREHAEIIDEAADGLRDMADTTPELRPGLRMGATRLDRMADTAAPAGAEDGDQ